MTIYDYHLRWFMKIVVFLLTLVLFLQVGYPLMGDTLSKDKDRDADILMEIFFLPHWPSQAVVRKVEKIVSSFKGITVKKYDFEDKKIEKYLKKYKIEEHMPVAIFINGKNTFTVKGKKIRLLNFPKGDTFVPIFAGEWDYPDLRAILLEIERGQ